ncbi:DUF5996 family protein [Streptosporangium sandarakinum]|uniref:DUF5996 family protein n=1 Tax=Streptosporangium sandarakinum TaxID=1260955 RepID=UPI0033AEFE92
MAERGNGWPALPVSGWQHTYDTLHMYAQVVGKISLALRPMVNHWWQVAFHLTARGLSTGPIPYGERTFEICFDLLDHSLHIETSDGGSRTIALGGAVRDFYAEVLRSLAHLGVDVEIRTMPVECTDPVRFDRDDRHSTYEAAQVQRFWQVLLRVEEVFTEFRARFTGKCSPVQFYWGAFDLSTTRYSGRPAEPPADADPVTKLSFNAEQSDLGFWPGGTWINGARIDQPVFYSYAYPEPPGFRERPVLPEAAYYDDAFGEFVLRYDDVRNAPDPRRAILDFAQSTFEAAARLQDWPAEAFQWAQPPPAGRAAGRAPAASGSRNAR